MPQSAKANLLQHYRNITQAAYACKVRSTGTPFYARAASIYKIASQLTVYQFSELDESAKERARDWYRSVCSADDDQWIWQDAEKSRAAFLDYFSAELRNGRYGSQNVIMYANGYGSDEKIGKLEYVRLWKYLHANYAPLISKIGECQFTGMCYDEVLLDGIAEFLRKPYRTDFESLLYSCCEDLRIAVEKDIEYQYSDESVDESITCNEYEFNEDGERV